MNPHITQAAVVELDAGLRVRVEPASVSQKRRKRWVQIPGQYSVTVGNSNTSSFSYVGAWDFLTGVSVLAGQLNRADA